jgi:hypothetical protein
MAQVEGLQTPKVKVLDAYEKYRYNGAIKVVPL